MPEAQIAAPLLCRLIASCRARMPLEACGILIGDAGPKAIAVSDLLFIPNASPSPANAFAFEPGAWVEAAYAAQRSRSAIVGVFHSHPASPARPSTPDRIGWDGDGSYWIVGFGSRSPEVRVYSKDIAGEWQELALTVR